MNKYDIDSITYIFQKLEDEENKFCDNFCAVNEGECVRERQRNRDFIIEGMRRMLCEIRKEYKEKRL